jgi:ketosteroid isomerase-like protein
MKRATSTLLLVATLGGCARPSILRLSMRGATTSKAMQRLVQESEVRVAEQQRFDAMMKGDMVALDTLLDEELTYVPGKGSIQSRKEFMDAIKKRSTVYDSIAAHDVRVRVYHGLALATGRADQRVRNAKGASKVTVRFTEIYVRREGRWLLSAWEAKKVASG